MASKSMQHERERLQNKRIDGAYVSGNTVRKLHEIPDRNIREYEQQKRQHDIRKKRSVSTLPALDMVSMGIVSFSVLAVLLVGFVYLFTQASVVSMKKQVAVMQAEIQDETRENDRIYQQIDDSVDLSYVYDVATGKLGMVQAVKNKVYTYQNKKSDMVKQYSDIDG